MSIDRLFSMLRREVMLTMRKYHNPPRMGLVTNYDPQRHAVKVQFQPEGTPSGWIPLTGLAVGNMYGIASAPNLNDQVEVHNHESDHMVARVMTRHWSRKNLPPQFQGNNIQPGEHIIVHQSGSVIYHKQDGTVVIAGAGATQTGQVTAQSGNTTTSKGTGNTGQSQQTQIPVQPNAQQTITLKPDGTMTISVPNNDMNITVGPGQAQPWSGGSGAPENSSNYNLTAQHQINITASTQDVTITATATNVNVNANSENAAVNISANSDNGAINLTTPNVNASKNINAAALVSAPVLEGSLVGGIG